MRTIGINHDMLISSAALVEDGKIIAAAAEERFTRQKHTRAFPKNAIAYCLREAEVSIEDIDSFASSWNPGVYLQKFNPLASNQRRSKTEYLYAVADHVAQLFPEDKRASDFVTQNFDYQDGQRKIHYITHHRTHAASAYYLSPFSEAAVFTADAQGEIESTTWGVGQEGKLEVQGAIDYPHSLGNLYGTLTEFLGYQANSDEWKVMALASFASSEDYYFKKLKNNLYSLSNDGIYTLNLNHFQGYLHEKPNLFAKDLVELLGPPRSPNAPLEDRHYAIASALQQTIEDILAHSLQALSKRTKLKNLTLSGGVFMNSVFNGVVLERTPFENVFIPSCPDDSGNALGAALYMQHQATGLPRHSHQAHNFYGPSYSDSEIDSILAKSGLEAKILSNAPEEAARRISQGEVIGWFQGRMEFGQRALGNRSILADPRDDQSKERVNAAIKFREAYRPFAPAVLAPAAKDWFNLGPYESAPFMEKVRPVSENKRSLIPAVTHVDGSGRLQTVERATNPLFYNLIESFEKLTKVPIVLNTSFNLNGEPVVESPEDAIRTFYSCGMDSLFLGSRLLTKKK